MRHQRFTYFHPATEDARPSVAISACLNGEAVRYDGRDKVLACAEAQLSKQLQLLPVCPEVGAGMSVPRPPVQLVRSGRQVLALGRDDPQLNVTHALLDYRQKSHQQLLSPGPEQICGYIFKSRSPSCGLGTTPIFDQRGHSIGVASGLQADYFMQQSPWLVFRDETQLLTEQQCADFIFLCFLSFDITAATGDKHAPAELLAICQHYQALIKTMDTREQQGLKQCAQRGQTGSFLQLFIAATEKILSTDADHVLRGGGS